VIVLDTNVVSEPLRAQPSLQVLAWLDRQAPETLYLTTISVAELWSGVELLPTGKRRTQLQNLISTEILPLFGSRVLSFDGQAAVAFARVAAKARVAGNRIDFADCAIAGIALTQRFAIATRNTKDFKGSGVEVINPWDSERGS
jgi:predicted nucleic acid-binding protein